MVDHGESTLNVSTDEIEFLQFTRVKAIRDCQKIFEIGDTSFLDFPRLFTSWHMVLASSIDHTRNLAQDYVPHPTQTYLQRSPLTSRRCLIIKQRRQESRRMYLQNYINNSSLTLQPRNPVSEHRIKLSKDKVRNFFKKFKFILHFGII
ncbi:hypothetical protein WN51_08584 [Melipona quadrifasciata]|uniref:Uncharacterized protein n=1 Tax=Melipona quadrifasciata TaxID=166423 RepID=A0A0M9A7I2_9HYME|nr:hypothetical protein WN51_08584 [Melipona quadrifasciata]